MTRALFAISLAAVFAAAPAYAGTCGQTAFYASFGDNTQVDDGPNTVDDPAAALYAMPALYLSNSALLFGNGVARTDQIVVDAAWPAVLQGYSAFQPSEVESAFLRFDLYYTHYSNTEGLGVVEETMFWGKSFVFSWYDPLQDKLRRLGRDREQWVSIRLDLLTGNAYAWQIDAYGNPVYDYGHFATHGNHVWDSGSVSTVLSMAADGNLYPMLYDDHTLSYMALYGITIGWDC